MPWTVYLVHIALSCSTLIIIASASDNINLQPRQQINADSIGPRFAGNSSGSDYFKLLENDGASLLVGARNAVYNLSMNQLSVQQQLVWPSSSEAMKMCHMKGKPEKDCHNYIRVMVKQPQDTILVCGTNAFNPLCRRYIITPDGRYEMRSEFNGFAISPFDPSHNSTATYVAEGDQLYAATVSDFRGSDPLIYRKGSLVDPVGTTELRTERNDIKCLHDPDFVSSFSDEDYVYFWFRETAVEDTNSPKAVYARVARVCKGDKGGPRGSSESWTTFVKARLSCTLPGDVPYAFNELQATSEPIEAADGNKLVYAVFNTPDSSVGMSALCAFRMADVTRVFDSSPFKTQVTATSLWLPVFQSSMPKPRPGMCTHDSRTLSPDVVSFITKNSLMDEVVPNYFDSPLIIDATLRSKFTQVAVDGQVRAVSGRPYDIVYAGTADGRIFKMVNTAGTASRQASTVLIEIVKVFNTPQPVLNLIVSHGRLVAVSKDEVRSLPLNYCANRTSCGSCVRLQDPYCAWDPHTLKCISRTDSSWVGQDFVQDIITGTSNLCPEGDLDPGLYAVNELYSSQVVSTSVSPAIYSADSMAIAVVATLAVACSIGFVIGFRMATWKKAQDNASSSSGSDYDAHSYGRSRLTKHDGSAHISDVYGPPPSKVHDIVLSMPSDSINGTLPHRTDKNLLTLNNGTLPKDYKVKKVYL